MRPKILALTASVVLAYPKSYHDDFVVDLGYAKHAPSWINTTTHGTTLLNYNNIRYAQPPIGNQRFRKPAVPPLPNDGISFGNLTASNNSLAPPSSTPPPSFPSSWETDCISSAPIGVPFPLLNGSTWGSEDCLFLNVVKPANAKPGDKLPVLHWVIGSAFAFGSKDWTGFGINTYGLWNTPYDIPGADQFIIVTHNYRLGVPGWTPKFSDDMNGNLGAWDSLAAMQWTKKYIDRFGGDSDNISVIGQSAGAAIIACLLMARNGTLELPFQQAWIASPTIAPRKDLERNTVVWDAILSAAGCGNIGCFREISPEDMVEVNKQLLIESVPGAGGGALGPGVGFTPTVDGELLSDLPANLLASGKINKNIKHLVVGNTAAEGMGLSSDFDMPARFPEVVRGNIPNATDADISSFKDLYPYPPGLPEKLAWDFTTDIDWTCNVANIASAYKHIARRQLFSVPPALHGLDLMYYFYDEKTMSMANEEDVQLAEAAKAMLLQFMFGKDFELPTEAKFATKLSTWPVYGDEDVFANVTLDGGYEVGVVPPGLQKKCEAINALVMGPENGV